MNGGNGSRTRRMRLLAVLSLLVVFVAGALVGAAVERGRHPGPPRGAVPGRGGPPPMFAEGSPMARRLRLTPAQRDSIEKLTARDRALGDSVFHATRRRMLLHLDSTMTAVEAVLTPEQRAEWRRIHEEWRHAPDEHLRRHGPPGPGGPRHGGPGGPPPGPPADGPH
jgi:Spy/CpxP family protein refolding chaperone